MTLADHLRSLPDDELAALLRLRPDLAVPVPGDVTALATRAQSRLSVTRALESLDLFTLQVLDAVRVATAGTGTPRAGAPEGGPPSSGAPAGGPPGGGASGSGVLPHDAAPRPASLTEVIALVAGAAPDLAVRQALDTLRMLAVVYGPDTALRVVPTVEECCSPFPANLGRPARLLDPVAGELASDPAALRRALLAAPEPARLVLDRLAAGPPIGTLRDARRTDPDEPADSAPQGPSRDSAAAGKAPTPSPPHARDSELSPVRWLISRHLLVPTDTDTVELPREVALVLRRDAGPLGELNPEPPAIEPALQDPAKVDAAGAGQAMEVVRQVDTLLEAIAAEPPPMLRAGGIGIREMRRLAKATGIEEPLVALLLETAGYAGLLADDREAEPRWLPTTAYDTWRDGDLAERWTRLVTAWLAMTRQPSLVGRRERTSAHPATGAEPASTAERRSARDRLPNVLGPDVERIAAPTLRRSVLECLGGLPDGAAPQAADVVRLLAWQTPRRGARHREETTGWALDQAAALGLTGLGALTSYGRPLIDGDTTEATAVLAKLLPEPVDHVLVQADLTVVVPGPPEPSLSADLALVAEPESGGGATVYRVTAGSVRRALDAGMAADELHELFKRRSVTPVPQGLTYLIDDAARRHGGVRVGSAGAYLRSDDAARLAEVSADRRLSHLGLRRIAPTVLVTPYAPARLLTALRECGYAPVPEDTTGAVVLTRPEVPRAPSRPSVPRPVADLAELDHPRALAVVEAIRRADDTARRARRSAITRPSPVVSVTETLGVLQQALRTRRNVWVGYVDAHGGDASRLVRPVSMGGGYLRAEDGRTEMVHTFALHRITSAALEE